MNAAVQLEDQLAAGRLVKPIDILGYNGFDEPCAFELGELCMSGIRLGIQVDHLVAIEVEESPWLAHEEAVADHLLGWVEVVLIPQALGASKIRDAAFRRNTGSAEKDGRGALFDDALQLILLLPLFVVQHPRYPVSHSFGICRAL